MSSIFETEDEFDFSDDDILEPSIFAKACQSNDGMKNVTNSETVCKLNGVNVSASDYTTAGKDTRLKTNSCRSTSRDFVFQKQNKDYSSSPSRLKAYKNHAGRNLISGKNIDYELQNTEENENGLSNFWGNSCKGANVKIDFEKSTFLQKRVSGNGKKKFNFVSNMPTEYKIYHNVDKLDKHELAQRFERGTTLETRMKAATNKAFPMNEDYSCLEREEIELDTESYLNGVTKENESLGDFDLKGSITTAKPQNEILKREAENRSLSSGTVVSKKDVDILTPSKKRKFPGPAGLLPKLDNLQDLERYTTPSKSTRKRTGTPKMMNSPVSFLGKEDKDFKTPFWLQLQTEALNKYKGLVYHSISMILKKACANELVKGKVPLMCALIKTFTMNGSDASIILKDPSGEIHGSIHKGVLESYQMGFFPGAGLILKHVSIFSPSSRKHYVNITPSNIVLLLEPESSVSSSQSCKTSQLLSSAQIPSSDSKAIFKSPHSTHSEEDIKDVKHSIYLENENDNLEEFLVEDDNFELLIDD